MDNILVKMWSGIRGWHRIGINMDNVERVMILQIDASNSFILSLLSKWMPFAQYLIAGSMHNIH
jgi:hypothetical protein